MTKQQLLTKRAIDCPTWMFVMNRADNVYLKPKEHETTCCFGDIEIDRKDWLAERDRLLNKPSWKDAPEWATHLSTTGKYWHWLLNACRDDRIGCLFCYAADKSQVSNKVIDIPAGYDWKQSLEGRPL